MIKRISCFILVLMMIPVFALGEAFHYQLSFSSAPAQEGSVLEGMLDFLKMMHLKGTFQRNDDRSRGFDLTANLTLENSAATNIDFHFWGLEELIHIQSPMWNDQDILINVPAMLEYGMKIYNHLDIPLQRFFIFYPYATCDAFIPVWDRIQEAMTPPDPTLTEWTVPSETLDQLGADLADMLYNERGVRIWLDTMTSLNAAGEELSMIWESIPEWLTNEIAEITVVKKPGSETWKTVSGTLFSSEVQSDGTYALHAFLPGFIFGENASFDYVRTPHGDTYDVDLQIALGANEHNFLSGTFTSRSIPANWPASQPFSAELDLHGSLLYGIGFIRQNDEGLLESTQLTDTLQVSISGDSDHVSLMNGDNAMLTANVTAESFVPETQVTHSRYEYDGLNFFSLHDSSLHDFMETAKDSLIETALPLIIHAPVSTVVSLMDVLQDGGILDLLAYGISIDSSQDEEYEEEYDESEEEAVEESDESTDEESTEES